MANVMSISRTGNIVVQKESTNDSIQKELFSSLTRSEKTYASNMINDWYAQMHHLYGNKQKTCDYHRDNLMRLIDFAEVAPWELRKYHVVRFLQRRSTIKGEPLAQATAAGYFSSWRSFQTFMLELDRVNEILREFKVRPEEFITEENSVSIKKAKSNWKPKGWALTDAQIKTIDGQYRAEIVLAERTNSKSYLPLIRDRVMFHVAIHFSLRVSELTTLQLDDFRAHHNQKLKEKFGDWGTLTITGKNDTTGTIPMREADIKDLLEWYVAKIRHKILLRRNTKGDGICKYDGKEYVVNNLLFPSERGGGVHPNTIRSRLNKIAELSNLPRRLTPHTLRHTGCTLMVPLYSPEIAQKYMRHKRLSTTLQYYHPDPLTAGNEVNAALDLFDDEDDE